MIKIPTTGIEFTQITVAADPPEIIAVTSTAPEDIHTNDHALKTLAELFETEVKVISHVEAAEDRSLKRLNEARAVFGLGTPTDDPLRYGTDLAGKRAGQARFIDTMTTPFFGICIWEQIMASMRGGEVQAGVSKEYGAYGLEFVDKDHPLAINMSARPIVFSNHFAAIVSSPAELGFEHLARTTADYDTSCEVAMIEAPGAKVSCQFHPEGTADVQTDDGKTLLKNFLGYADLHKPASSLPAAAVQQTL